MWSERLIFCRKKTLMFLGYLSLLANHGWKKQSHLFVLTYSITHTVLWVTARWWRFRSMSTTASARWAYWFFVQKFLLHKNFTRLLHWLITFLLIKFSSRMYPRLSMLADVFSAWLNALVGLNGPIEFTFVFDRVVKFYFLIFVILVTLDSSAILFRTKFSYSLLDLVIQYFHHYVAFPKVARQLL